MKGLNLGYKTLLLLVILFKRKVKVDLHGCPHYKRWIIVSISLAVYFLARLLILIKKGGLLQLKFGVVGVGVNIYLWAR